MLIIVVISVVVILATYWSVQHISG